MDDDFFADQGQTVTMPNQSTTIQNSNFMQSNQQPQEDEFQFQQPVGQGQRDTDLFGDYSAEQNEALAKIREEQERIQEQLRQKANIEYEQKMKRKEKGRLELQAFLDQKDKQKQERKAQNKFKEEKLRQNMKKLTEEAGWRKVAANVALKQGEHPGKKDIGRMRQSIVNKKNDQLN